VVVNTLHMFLRTYIRPLDQFINSGFKNLQQGKYFWGNIWKVKFLNDVCKIQEKKSREKRFGIQRPQKQHLPFWKHWHSFIISHVTKKKMNFKHYGRHSLHLWKRWTKRIVILIKHKSQFIWLYGYVVTFTQQGLKKLNYVTTKQFQWSFNYRGTSSLNREEKLNRDT